MPTPMSEGARALAEQWQHLPAYVVRRMGLRGELREEALCEGVWALCEAARRFDPARGVKPSTYLYKWIWGVVRRHLDNRSRRIGAEHAAAREEVVVPRWCAVEQADLIESTLRSLHPRERKVVELTMDGHTRRGIGRILGISAQRVRQLLTRARERLC